MQNNHNFNISNLKYEINCYLPDSSGAQSMGEVGGLLDVLGEDRRGEAVAVLVRPDGHLIESFENRSSLKENFCTDNEASFF
jgi:hypothetical protein